MATINSACWLCKQVDPDDQLRVGVTQQGWVINVRCDRCGPYSVHQDLVDDQPAGLPRDQGLRISGFLRETRTGYNHLLIKRETLNELLSSARAPQTYSGYVDRVISLIAEKAALPGMLAQWACAELAARTYLPVAGLQAVLGQLASENILTLQLPATDIERDSHLDLGLTSKGWERADALGKGVRGDAAFVAMWFDSSMDAAFSEGFAKALETCGYERPFKVNDPEHDLEFGSQRYTNKIDDRILANIRRSRFLIADATGARASVYYEAGFADALGIPVIWSCQEDAVPTLAFDTRQFAHIVWKSPADLCQLLIEKLRRMGLDLKVRSTRA